MQQVTYPVLCSDWALLFPVITGTVTSLANGPRGTLLVSVSLIKTYKAGRMTITQVGETMSVKLVSTCKKCPLFRRGISVLDTHLHTLQIISIFIYSKILINLCGLFLFLLRDRCQLHYHGTGGWRRSWNPATWCIHSPVQSPTSQTINEYQQPTLLTSCRSRPGNS